MLNLRRRIRKLEKRLGPGAESEKSRYMRMRLENARRRCGLLPPTPERLAELRGMTVTQILHLGRERARLKRDGP
jgi:hypothetical protein